MGTGMPSLGGFAEATKWPLLVEGCTSIERWKGAGLGSRGMWLAAMAGGVWYDEGGGGLVVIWGIGPEEEEGEVAEG